MTERRPGIAYHEDIATGWAGGYRSGGFKRRLALFRGFLDREPVAGQRWLDLGCGAGVLSAELVRRGATVVAMDGAPAMLAAARASLAERELAAIELVEGDAHDLSRFASASFDGALCSSVIEYADEPRKVLAEMARVLKPSARAIVSVPPRGSTVRVLQRAVRRLAAPFGWEPFRYLRSSRVEYDPAELAALAADLGLEHRVQKAFDPVLPAFLLGVLRPSLHVHEFVRGA